MIKILTHHNFTDTQTNWDNIFKKSANQVVFLTSWWNHIWHKYIDAKASIDIIEIYENENLIGIAPLSIEDKTIKFIGDENLYDYKDFIVIPGKESTFFEQLCKHIRKIPWDKIELDSIPYNSPTLDYIPKFFEIEKNNVDIYPETSTPTLILTRNWDDYLSALSKKHRHELKRKIKRLASQTKYETHICKGSNIHQSCLNNFFNLHKLSSEEKLNFWNPEREGFFEAISNELICKETLILHSLILEDKCVATAYIIQSNESFLLYNSGFNPQFSEYSVGLLNTAFAIEYAIISGQKEFNFLKGKEKYKYHLGAQDMNIFNISISK